MEDLVLNRSFQTYVSVAKHSLTDFRFTKKPLRKKGSRYTKKQYSCKGNEVVNNVKVIGHLLCDFNKFEFYEWSPEIIDFKPSAQ